MGKFIDMTGWVMKEHGVPDSRLTVIRRAANRDKHVFWLCKCECGNELEIRGDQIRGGIAKSCGCYQKDVAAQYMAITGKLNKNKGKPISNYIGQKINMLTLIEPVYDDQGRFKWKCRCECGNYTYVTTSHLNDGHTKSCGCIHSFTEKQLSQLFNELHLNYSREYIFDDLLSDNYYNLRFDFAIFNDNKLSHLIEYDGEQHFYYQENGSWNTKENYEKGQIRDTIKNNYCIEHNIPLIRIPYTHFNHIILEDLQLETSQFIFKGDD